MIGLSLSQQAVMTVQFESTDEFYATVDNFIDAISDGYSWLPMLILTFICGIAIAYVTKFMGWINF